MKINSVGATYGTTSNGFKYNRTQDIQKNQFDGFILFKKTSASSLLGRFKNED